MISAHNQILALILALHLIDDEQRITKDFNDFDTNLRQQL